MQNLIKLLLCLTVILAACQPNKTTKDVETVSERTSISADNIAIDEKLVISSERIGQAQLGMTLGELKQAAPDMTFKLKPEFMVDISAIAAIKTGVVQYYILFISNLNPSDSDTINYIMTQNPQYQTPEGVKVGMKIKEVAEIYGKAVLSYNLNNESREYIEFKNTKTQKNIQFRPNSIEYDGLAGIYPEPVEEYNQTENYHDNAEIKTIEVWCPPLKCS